jgi:hypothetical protein
VEKAVRMIVSMLGIFDQSCTTRRALCATAIIVDTLKINSLLITDQAISQKSDRGQATFRGSYSEKILSGHLDDWEREVGAIQRSIQQSATSSV